ncbi:hypothetical protein GCM10020000_00930 [Streptomyces olivoverticillatus]
MIDIATGLSMEPPDGLHHAEEDQPLQAGRQAAQQRPEGEDDEPGLEDAPPPDPVGRGPGQHQQRGEDEGVGVDGPLQAGDRGTELLADGGQGHVQHGVVEADDQQAGAADREDEQASAAAEAAGGGRTGPWGVTGGFSGVFRTGRHEPPSLVVCFNDRARTSRRRGGEAPRAVPLFCLIPPGG